MTTRILSLAWESQWLENQDRLVTSISLKKKKKKERKKKEPTVCLRFTEEYRAGPRMVWGIEFHVQIFKERKRRDMKTHLITKGRQRFSIF